MTDARTTTARGAELQEACHARGPVSPVFAPPGAPREGVDGHSRTGLSQPGNAPAAALAIQSAYPAAGS